MADTKPSNQVDLFVIGGGINGVGMARDAAGRGLSVALAEQGDLAGATSSFSSKLAHGGLRQLGHRRFRLLREALAERDVLMRTAPHLVRPLRFVVPLQPGLRPAWLIRLGLFLDDLRGGKSAILPGSESIDLRRSHAGDGLQAGFRKGFAYSDCRVDDARLVVANARDAADRGAQILTRTLCVAARREGSVWSVETLDRTTRLRRAFRAGILVNAAGPWVGEVAQRVAGVATRRRLRLVKGSHVVVPRLYQGEHALLLQNDDGRVVFVVPFEQHFSLVGTTEVAFAGAPGPVAITAEEVAYLQRALARYLNQAFEERDIAWSWAGLRPLYDDGGTDPSTGRLDDALELDGNQGVAPLLSMIGGTIATYRRLAEHALTRLRPFLPALQPAWTATAPLPGGAIGAGGMARFVSSTVSKYPNLPTDLLRSLARRHGSALDAVLGDARAVGDLGIDFGGGLFERELDHFIRREWARTAEDVVRRRSKAVLHLPPGGEAAVARWLAARGLGDEALAPTGLASADFR